MRQRQRVRCESGHHRTPRPICLYDPALSPSTLQGCVNILSGLATKRHASLDDEPAELAPRAATKPKATNVMRGTKRAGRIPVTQPRKMQSTGKQPSPSHASNDRRRTQSVGSTSKFATKNMLRLSPPAGANLTTAKFALKNMRRQQRCQDILSEQDCCLQHAVQTMSIPRIAADEQPEHLLRIPGFATKMHSFGNSQICSVEPFILHAVSLSCV